MSQLLDHEEILHHLKTIPYALRLVAISSGVSIFVNGWTQPGADELKRIMMTHGGVYHHYYNSHKTTHIIASNLPGNTENTPMDSVSDKKNV